MLEATRRIKESYTTTCHINFHTVKRTKQTNGNRSCRSKKEEKKKHIVGKQKRTQNTYANEF